MFENSWSNYPIETISHNQYAVLIQLSSNSEQTMAVFTFVSDAECDCSGLTQPPPTATPGPSKY